MGTLGAILVGVAITLIAELILFFALPALEEPRQRFLSWIKRRPHVSSKKMEELRILESIEKPLLKINSIPSYPDELKAKDIRDILLNIGEKMKKIKSEEFDEIKGELLGYSKKSEYLHVNMNPLDALKMLGRDSAMKLVEKIRKILAEVIKGKKKKKK